MAFFILTRFVLVKYSRAFVKRPSQGTSSLALQLTTVSLESLDAALNTQLFKSGYACTAVMYDCMQLKAKMCNTY